MPYYNNVHTYPYNNWNNNYTHYNQNWNNNWHNNNWNHNNWNHRQWGNGWTAQSYANRWYPGWNAFNYRWDNDNDCWRVYLRRNNVYITVFVFNNYSTQWYRNGYLW